MSRAYGSREDFICAIRANPEGGPYPAYSDWLEEHGEELRGQFMRRVPGTRGGGGTMSRSYNDLQKQGYFPGVGIYSHSGEEWDGLPAMTPFLFAKDPAKYCVGFLKNGCLLGLKCSLQKWVSEAHRLLWHPKMKGVKCPKYAEPIKHLVLYCPNGVSAPEAYGQLSKVAASVNLGHHRYEVQLPFRMLPMFGPDGPPPPATQTYSVPYTEFTFE